MMHLKQGSHLYNNLKYIMDPEKTKGGLLVGGNAGVTPPGAYRSFLETKNSFNKSWGRQAYHFVISFSPNETTEDVAYKVLEEWCKEYLGDDYDYVFSIHDDQDHIHGHITFNSVSRTTGSKYRYEKGDWEKHIQPITDKICKKYDLQELTYEKKRVGKHYIRHMEEKKGKSSESAIIKRDIDYAISKSNSWDEYTKKMNDMGYALREGQSKDHGVYVHYKHPVFEKSRGRRDYILGEGYKPEHIRERILNKDIHYVSENDNRIKYATTKKYTKVGNSFSRYQAMKIKDLFRANNYPNIPDFNVSHFKVRKDLLEINKLSEECRYLISNKITSKSVLEERQAFILMEEKHLSRARKTLQQYNQGREVKEYANLITELDQADEERVEEILDRLEELEESYNFYETSEELKSINEKLKEVRREKKIIYRIKGKDDPKIASRTKVDEWQSQKEMTRNERKDRSERTNPEKGFQL